MQYFRFLGYFIFFPFLCPNCPLGTLNLTNRPHSYQLMPASCRWERKRGQGLSSCVQTEAAPTCRPARSTFAPSCPPNQSPHSCCLGGIVHTVDETKYTLLDLTNYYCHLNILEQNFLQAPIF